MFVAKSNKTIKDLLVNLHQDLFINNFSVHDEIVNLIDRHLHRPLALQMVRLIELQNVFNRLKVPYITFKFDVEFDKWGSYTATSALNPYKYHLDITKHLLESRGFEKEDKENHSDADIATHTATNVIKDKEDTQESQEEHIRTDEKEQDSPKQAESHTQEIEVESLEHLSFILSKMREKEGNNLVLSLPDKTKFIKHNYYLPLD